MGMNGADMTRDQKTGRYEAGLDRLCVCGHRNGEHTAGGHECQACECDKFRRVRK